MTFAVETSVPHQQIDRYLRSGIRHVSGWLDSRSAEIIATLGLYQPSADTNGSIGEIGVHHGKLFILLDLLRRPGEKSFAVDLFDDQVENVDQSGLGDIRRFSENLERYSRGPQSVVMFRRNSIGLRPEELLEVCGPARLLSVDGGHTAECTLNDLRIADAVLTERGIVVVDDYFNPMWPDVSAGVGQYILDSSTTLRPFAIAPNKLFFARPEWHDEYRTVLQERRERYYLKTSHMFGHEVNVFGYNASTSSRRNLINAIKRSPVGPLATRVYRHYRGATQAPTAN